MSRAVKHIASPVATPGSKFCYYCILPGAWQPALNLVQGRTLQGPGRQLTQTHKCATQQKFNRCIEAGLPKNYSFTNFNERFALPLCTTIK